MKTRLLYAVCLLIMVLISYSSMTAQTRKGIITANSNIVEIKNYFSDNISLLDPIEGLWSVEETRRGWNNYISHPSAVDNFKTVIVKSGKEFKNLDSDLILERIGETNAYNCKIVISGPNGPVRMSKRVILENGISFNCTFDLPIKPDMVGNRGTLSLSFVKEYPTASMYQDAINRRQDEKVSEWSGSGFALNNGYVCTNYHVVEGAKSIKIYGVNGDFSFGFSATVVATDKINDLAILKMTGGFSAIPYSVKTTMDEVGEDVFVLGYPLTATMGDEVKLTTGVISSRTGFQGDVSMYQISAPVQPGSSGGPLFDSSGNLIGIINAYHTGAENVSYAIKASYLQKLVNLSLSTDILPENNLISSLPLTGKVSEVKNYVYYIKCSSKSYIFQSNRATPSTNHSSSSGNSGSGVSAGANSPIVSSATGDGTSSSSYARIDVSNPYVKNSPRGLTIKRVRVTDTRTIIDLEYDNNTSIYDYGWWVNISLSSYIIVDKWYKVTLTKAEGIPIAPEKHYFSAKNEKLQFTLVFPTLPSGTTEFDLIESAESPWKFYGIRLK